LEEQWILRRGDVPACSLKKITGGWTATLLNANGISSSTIQLSDLMSLAQAQKMCEIELQRRGWK